MRPRRTLEVVFSFSALFAATAAEHRTLYIRRATSGRAIDPAYHDAAIRVDLAKSDLVECSCED